MKLLENANALPFEAQKHCKLSLADIQDIRERYENGERISHIHLDYPQVSIVAVRYWAKEENRQADLTRRKQDDSYIFAEREAHEYNYYLELKQRRIDNGLSKSYYIRGQYATSDTTPLTEKQKKLIEKLYEKGYSTRDIENETGIKYSKCQSYFDNINPEWYKKARQNRIDKRNELLNSVLSDKLNGMTRRQMAKKYNTTPDYITNLLWKAGWRKEFA